MARDGKGPERIDGLLADFLEKEGVREAVDRQTALAEWEGQVGSAIAKVTRARSVAEGTLVVEVRSSAWLMELNMMKGEILRRLNEGLEIPIEKLVFVLSPDS